MKFRLLAPFALAIMLPFAAQAEQINAFDVSANLAADRTLTVRETIAYDFGDEDHHGIERFIPEQYSRNGANYDLHLHVVSATRDGQPEPYTTSESDGELDVKIGDPDKTITGAHTYGITYTTDRALNDFPDHTELYWNVTGNGWDVPINETSIKLTLPGSVAPRDLNAVCYTGESGSTQTDCTTSLATSAFSAATTRPLDLEEGLTVVFGFPTTVVHQLTTADHVWQFFVDNVAVAFPLLALIAMLALWFVKGRDPAARTVVPEYEAPKGYTPAMCAIIKNGGVADGRAVTATIIDLARRGFLHIRFGEEKHLIGASQTFTFVKQTGTGQLTPYEQTLYDGLFADADQGEVTLASLKGSTFYRSVAAFKTLLQRDMDALNLFSMDPQKVRGIYVTVGVIVGFILFYALGNQLVDAVCAIGTGVIIAVGGFFMPRHTAAGIQAVAGIKGFEWFLSVTEKDRLDFTDAPARTPEQFEACLPYAIAFGVEKKWAAQFASMTLPPPRWAEGVNAGSFSAVVFANNLTSLNQSAQSTAYLPPSTAGSGGSGFGGGGSGGGFGGGGGGSW